MAAPSAPVLLGRCDGAKVRLRFAPVSGAATYNVYVGGATAPTTAHTTGVTIAAGESWGAFTYLPHDADSFVRITAVNAGAEESGYSNELVFRLR